MAQLGLMRFRPPGIGQGSEHSTSLAIPLALSEDEDEHEHEDEPLVAATPLCILLLRPNRYQRFLERIISPRAGGSFLSPDSRSSKYHAEVRSGTLTFKNG